jgi:hypothetical protein
LNETLINQYFMRKFYFLILLLLLFSGSLIGQNIRIHGIVTDLEGVPIPDAWIQDNGVIGYLTCTDSSGYFSVMINFSEIAGNRHYLTCSSFGFQGVRVPIDTAFQNIVLYPQKEIEPNRLSGKYPASLAGRYYGYDPNRISFSIYYGSEINCVDFSVFSNLFDSTNITSLGNLITCKFDASLMLKNYMLRIGYGLNSGNEVHYDSVNRHYSSSIASIELGLLLPIGSHVMINYFAGFTNYRFRMVNEFSKGDGSLSSYLKKPEIDLRFNQPCITNRLELGYRTNFPVTEFPVDFFYGVFGGFNVNASRSTLVYSRNSRLMSDQSIVFDRFIYGLKLAVIFKNCIY